jgi:hypothetical protein
VVGIAVLTGLLRLAYLRSPMSPDEGGFLMVAGQWRPGPSMYGHYWVDRPPLLLELFRAADAAGGLVALRLIGCLAAGVTVLGVALAVRRIGTGGAATWSAAVACGLLVSPLLGSTPVNGELLAAPFVALGLWLSVAALADAGTRRGAWAAAAAGACAAAAVLVKQNMLDVFVFVVVLGLLAHLGRSRHRGLVRAALCFAAGSLAGGVVVLGAAMLSGTSPGSVLFAMYPFRLQATSVVAHSALTLRITRLLTLGNDELLSAGPLVLAALVLLLVVARSRRRLAGEHPLWVPVAGAAFATTLYDVVSVVAGGSYWDHYLVQLAVPTALAAGLVVTAVPRIGRQLAAVAVVAALVAWVVGFDYHVDAHGVQIGTAVGHVSEPGDTMVSALGDPVIPEEAGLSSPYPYLWSLPARTLDPGLHGLDAVLAGPHAPTWLVVRGPQTLALLHPTPRTSVASHYHLSAQICGRSIYLHDGVQRPVPRQLGPCDQTLSGGFAPFDELTEEIHP